MRLNEDIEAIQADSMPDHESHSDEELAIVERHLATRRPSLALRSAVRIACPDVELQPLEPAEPE
jgi:hypothetical protein